MQFAVLGAVIVGGGGGGVIALLVAPTPTVTADAHAATGSAPAPHAAESVETAAPTARAPVTTASAPPPHTPEPVAAPPEPRRLLATTMTTVLTRFIAWAPEHAGEPCPDLSALEIAADDPWGRALELTCVAQPKDQILGVVSAGPDGIPGNSDDIASWTLGRELTALVRGGRWQPSKAAATRSRPPRHRKDGSGASSSAGPVTRPDSALGSSSPQARAAGSAAPAADSASAPPPPAPALPTPPPAARSNPAAVDAGTDDIPSRRSPR